MRGIGEGAKREIWRVFARLRTRGEAGTRGVSLGHAYSLVEKLKNPELVRDRYPSDNYN